MKCCRGIWFPDNEIHLVKMLQNSSLVDGKGTYQLHKLNAAMQFVRNWHCALDVGMHVGLWAIHLAKRFKKVIGFEPVLEHIECLHLNMKGYINYEVNHCALGNHIGSVGLKFLEGSTGSTHIDPANKSVEMFPLDNFDLPDEIDFIKIDVEGYERLVVEGAENTIRNKKPVIIIEQKGGKCEYYNDSRYGARDLLLSWGGKQKFELNGDCCIVF